MFALHIHVYLEDWIFHHHQCKTTLLLDPAGLAFSNYFKSYTYTLFSILVHMEPSAKHKLARLLALSPASLFLCLECMNEKFWNVFLCWPSWESIKSDHSFYKWSWKVLLSKCFPPFTGVLATVVLQNEGGYGWVYALKANMDGVKASSYENIQYLALSFCLVVIYLAL